MKNRKIVAKHNNVDFNDCTSRGYIWTLYGDGSVAAEYRSCWQRDRTGTRWCTEPGEIDLAKCDDPEKALKNLADDSIDWLDDLRGYGPISSGGWTVTNRGIVVR